MGEGFDFFYGFMGAEMNHWYPQLYQGRYAVEPDRLPEDGYHGPDESFAWKQVPGGIKAFARYFELVAGAAARA